MTVAAPTFSQIEAQVAAIQKKRPAERVIGIHSPGRWTGAAYERHREATYAIHQCDSPLAMRMALRQPTDEHTTKILITPLEDKDLSEDILLRLAKRRLFPIDAWHIVRDLFQAHAVDPRLTRHSWMASTILDKLPTDLCPAARGGFLDAELVWPLLLNQVIGLVAEAPDLTALLKWSLDAEATAKFRRSGDLFQAGAMEWLIEKAGPVAGIVLQCVARLELPDTVPIGLAAGVVFHPAARGKLEKAAGKLEERYLGGRTPEPGLMLRWHTGATEVVRALRHTDFRCHRQTLARADEILREINADSLAHLSDISQLGFDQRLSRFGQALAEMLDRRSWTQVGELQAAHTAVRAHDQCVRENRRLERVETAQRLTRWLAEQTQTDAAGPSSFGEAATQHLRENGFVDWARLRLRAGDPVRELSEAYARLFDTVTHLREQQAKRFAQLLVDWTTAGSRGDAVVPVEKILEQVVAPLAAERSVLIVVVDGMSVAVCWELLADLTRHEWTALCEPGYKFNRPGVATIPSVTEFSRTSLLCGRLQQGAAANEQIGFAEHPALVSCCRNGSPPILFHKVALQESEDAILAKEVRDAIQSTHRKIVGVVVNAVDDHLLKGDQLDIRWSRDEIKVLPALLHEARIARRLVVLVSDHGHVLDSFAQGRSADGGERWRTATSQPAADELLVEGQRVLTSEHRLIAPWSERVRYGIKKNGYHGGLTPQEMVVPIVVLSSTEDLPKGWQEQAVDSPAWWDEPARLVLDAAQSAPLRKIVQPKPSGSLFDLATEVEASRTPTPTLEATPPWVTLLVKSAVFDEQMRLAGRGLPSDELLAKLLGALDGHGGKMTMLALARTLAFPEVRLPGLLAKMQRLLNVDGYAVLSRDDASNTIELNRELLLKQFELA